MGGPLNIKNKSINLPVPDFILVMNICDKWRSYSIPQILNLLLHLNIRYTLTNEKILIQPATIWQ